MATRPLCVGNTSSPSGSIIPAVKSTDASVAHLAGNKSLSPSKPSSTRIWWLAAERRSNSRALPLPCQEIKTVHLYGSVQPPAWLNKLPVDVAFSFHNSGGSFITHPPNRAVEASTLPHSSRFRRILWLSLGAVGMAASPILTRARTPRTPR